MIATDARFQRMLTASPTRLVVRHSVPTIISAVLPSASAMADAFFTARLGTEACGAIGIAFPIVAAIQTIGFVFGTGAGSLLSRLLGARETEEANAVASCALTGSVLLSLLFCALGLAFLSPLLRILGASEEIFPLARVYATCLLTSAPLMCAAFVLSNLLRAEGKTVWAMVGLGTGNLLCVAMNPLLIFRLGLGILGAGLSVPIGYGAAALILLLPYLFRKSTVFLRPKMQTEQILKSVWNGLPSLFRQGLTVVAVILLNRAARLYGDPAIAALAITSRWFLFLYGFCLGIGQGMLPAAGFNYGSGNTSRTRSIYLVSMAFACGVSVLLAVPTAVFAPDLIACFRKEESVVQFGVPLLRALCAVFPLHGIIAVTNILLQGLGKPVSASLVAAARQGLFFLPLIFILPNRFGFAGIVLTQPLADALTFLFTLPFLFSLLRELNGPSAPNRKKRSRRL